MHPCLRVASLPPPPTPPPTSPSPAPASLSFPVPSSETRFCSKNTGSSNSLSLDIDNNLRTLTLSATTCASNKSKRTDWDRTMDYLSHSVGILDPLAAVSQNPALRSLPLSRLQQSHSLLLSAGLSPAQISRICSCFPLILTHPNVGPALDFLRPLFRPKHLPLCLSRCPRLLLTPVPTRLLPALHFLRSLSVPLTPSSSILLMSDVESTLLPKLHFFQHHHHIALPYLKRIIRKFPKILTLSIDDNLQPKLLFLTNNMNLHARTEITRFPQYFAFSLDNRIKPRHLILKQKGLRMPLRDMLSPSDAEFEEAIIDIKLRAIHSSRRRHPPRNHNI